MARNKYAGICYKCGKDVPPGYGHFERYNGVWLVKCVKCASGRILTKDDQGVIWAEKEAAKEAAKKRGGNYEKTKHRP